MKRQVVFLSCIIATLLLYGCDKHEQNNEKPIYNAMAVEYRQIVSSKEH